jgi:hypothetical protein
MLRRLVILGFVALLTLGAELVPTPKSQCEDLLNAVLPFAKKMLSEHGEFYPFGASMKPNGEIIQAASYDGRERPTSQSLIDILRDSFRAEAKSGAIIACATVYDVRTVPPGATAKTDAVAVELDHRDSYSVVVLIPYTLSRGSVQFAEAIAERGKFEIFGQHGG